MRIVLGGTAAAAAAIEMELADANPAASVILLHGMGHTDHPVQANQGGVPGGSIRSADVHRRVPFDPKVPHLFLVSEAQSDPIVSGKDPRAGRTGINVPIQARE